MVALLSAMTLVGGLAVTPSVAQTPSNCPEIVPIDQLQKGQIGTGYTVADGTTVETFKAEILGVQENALGPGRDLIVAELSGGPVDDHGFWFGMSGAVRPR